MFLWKPNLASPLEEEVARRTPWMSASKFFGLSLSHAFEFVAGRYPNSEGGKRGRNF